MNKKRLSVVMAGAMLATSVAPVLAAETTTGTEIAYNNKVSLKADILADMAKKENKISDYAIFGLVGNPFVSEKIQQEIAANTAGNFSSKLGIKITKKDGTVVTFANSAEISYKSSEVAPALDALEAGDKVEVYSRETHTFGGQVLPGSEIKATSDPAAYNKTNKTPFIAGAGNIDTVKTELAPTIGSAASKIITAANVKESATSVLTVKTNKTTTDTGSENVELVLKDTDNRLDGRLAYDANNQLLDITKDSSVQSFDHFGELVNWSAASEEPNKKAELTATYVIGEKPADGTKETVKVSDLFDGIALTEKGTAIVADLANAKDAFDKEGTTAEAPLVLLSNETTNDFDNTNAATTGVYRFTIAYYKNGVLAKAQKDAADNAANIVAAQKAADKVITVTSTDKAELKGLYNLLDKNEFNVGVVAGQNRYETAVSVAKQQGITTRVAGEEIVLVNGMSLVDGLAAAPLAAEKSAPLLLTEEGRLSTATKEYIESLIDGVATSAKRNITVNLVGGETVLNDSLVNELEGMGLTVKRLGGANREATSLEVAKALTTKTKAFVVGANGEADAMSISSVAANEKAPIIVSKVGGLSNEVIDFLRKEKTNDITIVGGEKVVSAEDEDKINDSLTGVKATRIAGANRIETNNAIVKKYYGAGKDISTVNGVVLVKDGIADKKELIDALSAANYAATENAPIVLASKEVTDAQKSTLLSVGTAYNKVIQVGLGAEGKVLETVANLLGVTNKVN